MEPWVSIPTVDLVPGAVAKHARPNPVPVIHLAAFKKELLHLIEIGVLSPQGTGEWVSPTFITPKKDGRVCWVSYLQELNKLVRRKQYPLPIIMDILRQRKGYKFFTKLDISMKYYTLSLMRSQKIFALLQHSLGNLSIIDYPWV
jgi:hypothetical protein